MRSAFHYAKCDLGSEWKQEYKSKMERLDIESDRTPYAECKRGEKFALSEDLIADHSHMIRKNLCL